MAKSQSLTSELAPAVTPTVRRWTRLSPVDRARLAERYELGENSTHLASEYGIAKSTVLGILREHAVVVRRQSLTQQQVAEAAKLYALGHSLSQVATVLSLKQDTIRLALKSAGVELRPPTGKQVVSTSGDA